MTVERLNDSAGIPDELTFEPGPCGCPVACIENTAASARISLHGAHVMSYCPTGARPVLWMSDASMFAEGEPIRGGIPICWPWFGAHPEDAALPSHGFVRRFPWEVASSESLGDAGTRLTLRMTDTERTREWWAHPFSVTYSVTVGAELTAELHMTNTGDSPFTVTAALHTYLSVSDVTEISVHGFDGCPSIDTVGGARTRGTQDGPIRVTGETDLILLDCPGEAWVDDPGWQRRLFIRKSGSRSAVVWNPWVEKSKRMPDFGDEEYPGMICVETTNAPGDEREVQPGDSHSLKAVIQAVPLG